MYSSSSMSSSSSSSSSSMSFSSSSSYPLVLLQLVEEGKVNPEVLTDTSDVYMDNENDDDSKDKAASTQKRGHLRICVRRSGSRFVPYPCFRGQYNDLDGFSNIPSLTVHVLPCFRGQYNDIDGFFLNTTI